MPTYQYACTNAECANRFELVQSFTDPAASACPVCASAVRKVYGSVGVVFKGSGFYRNDSRKAAESAAAKSESKTGDSTSESKAAASTSSDSKSDGKSDAKKSDAGTSAKPAASSTSSSGSGANAPSSGKAAASA